ncbi:copper amine oxidase N-terminal domain-containing protein [Saccharibacillus kuerlensis]|uniref:Copper amine oxidase-like N-terminal domain-containing protein n=1 Tax=Saccharibacillus kuerlensis TaxID=459527 RepID=A0ABQ2KTK2_9BACL|nr:copper amine oxidase N-terminal domain-containing protein [Saccharibacillus kuerlensis]GGN92991.1 hypothetical protein GCM10010969_06060 [Saccharibacillus kuerlensis]
MRLAKKSMALLFVLLLTIGMAVPASAAEKTTLTLQMKVGSSSALVNGEKQVIEKPYVQAGMTMVPLGVFQRAFGTVSRLEGENTVKLTYGSRTVTFAIGSKTAWVNGKKRTLTAAPVMRNGILMVPMRPITDMLGARVTNSSGKIVITLKSDKGIPGQESDTDKDKVAPRIGSSYANWSIDYPAGSLAQLGNNEFSAIIGDLEGSYMLQIHVWEEGIDVPVSDMLEQLEREAADSGEAVLDEQTFPEADIPYVRIITRDAEGVLWEARRYYVEGRVYSIYLGDSLAEDYRDFEGRAALLDSFRPVFATPGIKTEDLSSVRNGYTDAAAPDYGVQMKVPAEWTPTGDGQLAYQGEDGSFLSLYVTSAAAGEKLSDWHDLLQKRVSEFFLPEYAEGIVGEPLQAAGQDAQIEKLTYDLGGGKHHRSWLVIEQKGYFYILDYSAPEGAYSERTFKRIVDSLEIDFDVVPTSFGKLPQVSYLKDKLLNATQSTSYFRLSIPAYWTTQAFGSMQLDMQYAFPGGWFRIAGVDAGLEAAGAQAVRRYDEMKLDDPTLTYEAPERVTFGGAPAIRIAYTGTDDSPYRAEDIYVRYKNLTYWIHYRIDQGAATVEQLDGIERALQSFRFVK